MATESPHRCLFPAQKRGKPCLSIWHATCISRATFSPAVASKESGRSDHPSIYPVSGKVFFKGKPAEGAQVTLVLLDESASKAPRPGAQVRKNGSFRFSTYASYDGAPASRYAVTIIYRSPEQIIEDETPAPICCVAAPVRRETASHRCCRRRGLKRRG